MIFRKFIHVILCSITINLQRLTTDSTLIPVNSSCEIDCLGEDRYVECSRGRRNVYTCPASGSGMKNMPILQVNLRITLSNTSFNPRIDYIFNSNFENNILAIYNCLITDDALDALEKIDEKSRTSDKCRCTKKGMRNFEQFCIDGVCSKTLLAARYPETFENSTFFCFNFGVDDYGCYMYDATQYDDGLLLKDVSKVVRSPDNRSFILQNKFICNNVDYCNENSLSKLLGCPTLTDNIVKWYDNSHEPIHFGLGEISGPVGAVVVSALALASLVFVCKNVKRIHEVESKRKNRLSASDRHLSYSKPSSDLQTFTQPKSPSRSRRSSKRSLKQGDVSRLGISDFVFENETKKSQKETNQIKSAPQCQKEAKSPMAVLPKETKSAIGGKKISAKQFQQHIGIIGADIKSPPLTKTGKQQPAKVQTMKKGGNLSKKLVVKCTTTWI